MLRYLFGEIIPFSLAGLRGLAQPIAITGRAFGRVYVLKESHSTEPRSSIMWHGSTYCIQFPMWGINAGVGGYRQKLEPTLGRLRLHPEGGPPVLRQIIAHDGH